MILVEMVTHAAQDTDARSLPDMRSAVRETAAAF
jgi:hypothetical protein